MSDRPNDLELERSNPFSTRFIRPGALKFVFEPGQDLDGVIARLASLDWRAQVVGPHGSGKSTLIAAMAEALEHAGRRPAVFAIHDGQRRMPGHWEREAERRSARLIIVDGYEQLSRASRWWVRWRCRRRDWGLLVTAHHAVGLPTLLRTSASLEIARAVVDQLVPARDVAIDAAVEACFAASRGNMRETLFTLYDRYERARR